MARKKGTSARARYDGWLEGHPLAADLIVGGTIAAALIGLFIFITFSGFGSSAEFIYNQF